MAESQQLLAEYARNGSDTAFRELVNRYVDLVYSTALRLVEGDTHRAQDVSQTVFVDLSRKARTLPADVSLGGWLHRNTCFAAATLMRGERRRQSRERQAVEMNVLQNTAEADFSQVAPILDEAINELGEADRTAILLRFFEQHDFRTVGEALGSNEDAARMRVTRALEKLATLLRRRGVTASSVTLGVALGANAVQAAPVGLAATISTAVALAGTTIAATTVAMTTLQKVVIGVTLAVALGTGIYEARQASTLRKENQMLQRQVHQLADTAKLSKVSAKAAAPVNNAAPLPNGQFHELLKLRGEVGVLRRETNELAQLRRENRWLRTRLDNRAMENLPSRGRSGDEMPDERNILAGYISWAGIDVIQVLQIYADLISTNTAIAVDQAILRRNLPQIAFTNSQDLTRSELAGTIEQLLRDRAGISVEHPNPNHITIKPQ